VDGTGRAGTRAWPRAGDTEAQRTLCPARCHHNFSLNSATLVKTLEPSRRLPCKGREGQRTGDVVLFCLRGSSTKSPSPFTCVQEPGCTGTLAPTSHSLPRLHPAPGTQRPCRDEPGQWPQASSSGWGVLGYAVPGGTTDLHGGPEQRLTPPGAKAGETARQCHGGPRSQPPHTRTGGHTQPRLHVPVVHTVGQRRIEVPSGGRRRDSTRALSSVLPASP